MPYARDATVTPLRPSGRRPFARGLVAAAALLAALGTRSSHAVDAADGRKRLARVQDPVVVSTAQLAACPDHHTQAWRLYRFSGGGAEPIRYQFDARDEHGDVRLDDTEFVFDADDELVFMAADTGDRAVAAQLPPGSDAAVEIEVVDPRDAAAGWAYLVHFTTPPPVEPRPPYVHIDPGGQRAWSDSYAVEYADGRNYFTGLRVLPAAGGSGQNLLRQTKMTGEPVLRLLFADLHLRFDERTTIVRVDGTKSGPVRAIRQVRLSVDLGSLVPDVPSGTVRTYHYANMFDTPSQVSIPWLVLHTLRGFRFENVFVFDPRALPLRYWDADTPAGVAFDDGSGDAVPTSVDHDWWVASGPAGSFLQAMEIPDAWKAVGIARGAVLRTASHADSADPYAAGYSLLNMTHLRQHGAYSLRQLTAVLPGTYHPGDESTALAMLRAPLQVATRRLR